MAWSPTRECCVFKDFDVDVSEGDARGETRRCVLRVGLKGEQDAASWLMHGLSSWLSHTNKLVQNVKESQSKKSTSPTKPDVNNNWNGVVDFLIQFAVKEVTRGSSSGDVLLPDIAPPADPSAAGLRAEFTARSGVLRDATTLHRIGDAHAVFRGGGDVRVEFAVGLAELSVTYGHYRAALGRLGPSGRLDVTVGGNSALVGVTLRQRRGKGECRVELSDVTVDELVNVRVKLTGFGLLNGTASKIISWRVDKMKETLAVTIGQIIKNKITEMLEAFCTDEYVIILKT